MIRKSIAALGIILSCSQISLGQAAEKPAVKEDPAVPTRSSSAASLPHHGWIAFQGGIGTWYSDDFHTSEIYGGGFLVEPGVSWLSLSLTYETTEIKADVSHPLFGQIDHHSMGIFIFGVTFPMGFMLYDIPTILYPLIGYSLTHSGSGQDHAAAIGGGMEFLFFRQRLGVRFEMRDIIGARVPYSGGHSGYQKDLHFLVKLVIPILNYWN